MVVTTAGKAKVVYASTSGFHTVDMDSGAVQSIYIPASAARGPILPHAIIPIPSKPSELLLCHDSEGIYMDGNGRMTKELRLQWGESPTSVALIGDSHVMGWGSKAIEIRAVDSGQLDGVFMHKRTQKLRFLCERNDKVFFASIRSSSNSQVYFMALNRSILPPSSVPSSSS